MANQPPYPVDDNEPAPDEAPASEVGTISPPIDQSEISVPDISSDPTPDSVSTDSAVDVSDSTGTTPAPPLVSNPVDTAPFGPKSVRGGNMAMRLLSRMQQDLAVLTGDKRAATYAEVEEYYQHAVRIERSLENEAVAALARNQSQTDSAAASDQAEAQAALNAPVTVPPAPSIADNAMARPVDQFEQALPTAGRPSTAQVMQAKFVAKATAPIPAKAPVSLASAARRTPPIQKPKPAGSAPVRATSVYLTRERAAWKTRQQHYLDMRRAAGPRMDPKQDAIERKSLDDDWKRIETAEAQRFRDTLNNSGRTGELIKPIYTPITEAQAIAIERRAGYSDAAMTQSQLKIHQPLNALNALSLGQRAEADTKAEYPGQDSWRNEADAFKHADWTIRLQRRLGTAAAQQIEDGHESQFPIRGSLETRGDRLQDITNNHNLRILSEIFPEVSPPDLARMAIRAGLAQTGIYTIVQTQTVKPKHRKKRNR